MKTRLRVATISVLAVTLIGSAAACSSMPTSDRSSTVSTPSCTQLLEAAIQYGRSGVGDVNETLQALTDYCSDEYDIAVDYLANSTDSEFKVNSCDELLDYGMRREAVTLLEQDAHCTFDASVPAVSPLWPNDGMGWDQARSHAGTTQRVCGPLMSGRETADGTFLNVGRDYPSAERFTFIFWGVSLESIESGATLCGSGEIYLYNGVAQMELADPGALEIWH